MSILGSLSIKANDKINKVNQVEIKIREFSFLPDWNALLSLPLFAEDNLDPVSCIFFDTNRQVLQEIIISKAMQRYSQTYYSIWKTRQWFYFVYKSSLYIKKKITSCPSFYKL